ncbi:MAG: transglycosylase domain-containing protein, partial [Firmicutes bacterium]|nr:transglycosylase domain-containing protein [Bacillota bacterium]
EIPEDMVNAIVAIEDKTFWKHNGFNFIRMAGAIKDSIFGGGQISGTSTLTQQLARNIYLTETKSERSLNRKILEAYYAILIEKNLTKEQIVEAYLNTVYLGFNSYGVEAASQAYFAKSVSDLNLLECTALASLPKSPHSYALVKSYPIGSVEVDPDDILGTTSTIEYVYNGELSQPRREQTLVNMVDQGYITQAEADAARGQDLRSSMKITSTTTSSFSSYFTDYVIDQAIADIMEEYGWTEEEARNKVYTGGLKIYTTMDSDAQKIAVDAVENGSNIPGATAIRKNSDGHIVNPASPSSILLYSYSSRINDSSQFMLNKDEYAMNSDGSMTLFADKWLKFYDITLSDDSADVSIDFRAMYIQDSGKLYSIEGGALSVPQGYKTKDAKGNCIISADFFKDYPTFFVAGNDGQMLVNSGNYTLKQKVIQPQASVVIFDYKTGGIKAMVGGRGVSGSMLYNRALSAQQPGSSIKPLAVYSTALQ